MEGYIILWNSYLDVLKILVLPKIFNEIPVKISNVLWWQLKWKIQNLLAMQRVNDAAYILEEVEQSRKKFIT